MRGQGGDLASFYFFLDSTENHDTLFTNLFRFFQAVPSNQVKGGIDIDARETLDDLMIQHGSRLLRLCAMLLRDASLAQDAVQDTFMKAFRRFDQYRGNAEALTWLTSIAINVCRDYRRTAWFRHVDRRVEADELPHTADFPYPDHTVINAVSELPPRYREVILLRYYQDMKQKDVAAVLGISVRAVRQRLTKANAILREQLKEWYEDEG